MLGKLAVGSVVLVRYEYSSRGDCADRSELVAVRGVAGDGCFELSNGDHLFWDRRTRHHYIDDQEIVPCSVS